MFAEGGGICFREPTGPIEIKSSLIEGNQTSDNGGGIYMYGSTELTISNTTITGNNADNGGGCFFQNPNVKIYNSTITNNTALTNGGGVYRVGSASIEFYSSITAGNTSDDLWTYSSQTPKTLLDHCLYDNAKLTGSDSYLITASQNLNGVTPKLNALADNGGSLPTISLQVTSLAIDAGTNLKALPYDNRGADFSRVMNGIADIGAFEEQNGGMTHTISYLAGDNGTITGTLMQNIANGCPISFSFRQ